MKELTKQQKEVVMPLIAECSKREAQCQIMFKEVVERNKNLKILWAMVRSPKLCDLVYKAERKRFTAEKLKELQEKSVFTLRQYKFDDKNAEKFVDAVYT